MDTTQYKHKWCVFMGDVTIDLLKYGNHRKINEYPDNIIIQGYFPVITKPARICLLTATLIDHI